MTDDAARPSVPDWEALVDLLTGGGPDDPPVSGTVRADGVPDFEFAWVDSGVDAGDGAGPFVVHPRPGHRPAGDGLTGDGPVGDGSVGDGPVTVRVRQAWRRLRLDDAGGSPLLIVDGPDAWTFGDDDGVPVAVELGAPARTSWSTLRPGRCCSAAARTAGRPGGPRSRSGGAPGGRVPLGRPTRSLAAVHRLDGDGSSAVSLGDWLGLLERRPTGPRRPDGSGSSDGANGDPEPVADVRRWSDDRWNWTLSTHTAIVDDDALAGLERQLNSRPAEQVWVGPTGSPPATGAARSGSARGGSSPGRRLSPGGPPSSAREQ